MNYVFKLQVAVCRTGYVQQVAMIWIGYVACGLNFKGKKEKLSKLITYMKYVLNARARDI